MIRLRKRDIAPADPLSPVAPLEPGVTKEYVDEVAMLIVKAVNEHGVDLDRKIALKGKRPEYEVCNITYDRNDRLTGFVLKPRTN